MKHTVNALFVLLILLTASSTFAQSALKKANKEFELNAFQMAVESYKKVLEKQPKNVVAMARLADCYRHLNQMDNALLWYDKAIKLPGVDPIHIFHYAKVLQSKGKYEDAKKWFLMYGEGQPIFGNHFAENCDFAISMRGIKPLYRIKNEYINTKASDFGAALLGDRLVYASTRKDLTGRKIDKRSDDWSGNAMNQLLITGRDDNDFLQRPGYLHPDLSNNYNEGPLSYTADGKTVAYTKNNFADGTRQIPSSGLEMSIYFADANENGDWSESVPFPYNGSGYSSGYPSLTPDGTAMYFSSNRPDGYGGYDIYVTYKVGDSWSTPSNLGPTVNSPGNELSPYYDGAVLYFSSDWHQGLGGLDIYRAEMEGDKWVKIYHLGNGVNSSRDDYGFVYDNKNDIGYFTSNRPGGKGQEDIYQVSKLTNNIEIFVLEASNKQPVQGATIDFSACGESVYKTGGDGKYVFQALAGMNCDVLISKGGFDSYALQLRTSGKKKNARFEVLLAKEADKYLGRVFNPVDNGAVDDVLIIATNQSNGHQIQTRTDANGTYSLALQPNVNYLIRFSKAGFLDTHNRISVGDGRDRGILGTLAFRPASTQIVDVPKKETPKKEDKPPVKKDKPTSPPKVTDTKESTEEPEVTIEKGYSVQIAAVAMGKEVIPTKYKRLADLGNIYSRPERGFKKVRLGIFPSRSEANEARKKVVGKGFKSAFVVSESLDDMVDVEFYYSPADAPSVPREAEQPRTQPTKEPTNTSKTVSNSKYKVRLAAYRNPEYFKASRVSDVGTVESRKSGEFTIMLLGGFGTLQEALSAQKKVRRSGFDGAYVVIEDNGRLVKVNL
ncbi:MAG: carboxypeptidase regulatory-like domain-containing protein [Bacteroidota bacterium]